MTQKTLSPNYLLTLVRHLEQMGLGGALAEQALDTDMVELENAAASGQPIPITLYGKFYRFYLQQMAGENFGFPDKIGDVSGRYQMLYTMMVNSKNLGSALKKLHEFYATFAINKQLIHYRSINDQQVAFELNIKMQAKYQQTSHQAIITANLAAGFHRVMCWLTGVSIPLEQMDIAGTPPEHPLSYQQLFSCPVKFGCQQTALIFNKEVMNYGIVQTEESLADFLHSFPEPLFSNPEQEQLSTRERVQAIIGHNLHREMPSLGDIGDMLDISETALKKALKAEQTSYHQMIELARQRQAIKLLTQSSVDLNSIAEQLGFPATSAFHRSFKRWTGLTPGDYRKEHQK